MLPRTTASARRSGLYAGNVVTKRGTGGHPTSWMQIAELAEKIRVRAYRPASLASDIAVIENHCEAIVSLTEKLKGTDSKLRMGS